MSELGSRKVERVTVTDFNVRRFRTSEVKVNRRYLGSTDVTVGFLYMSMYSFPVVTTSIAIMDTVTPSIGLWKYKVTLDPGATPANLCDT